ncbi:MAG: phage/plasmid primase, P4 family [Solirubrobacterales bacterium]
MASSESKRWMIMSGKNGDLPRFSAAKLGKDLLDENPAAKDAGGRLYAYHDDRWQPDGKEFYAKVVRDWLAETWLPKHASEVLQWISDGAPKLDASPPLDRIRVLNGILMIGKDRVTLEPHSPDPLTPVCLPVTYDRRAKCPTFTRFMRQALDKNVRLTAQEVMGYVLLPDNKQQKAFLAQGGGGNGKTTWVRVICELLGRENYSAHSLHSLDEDKFAVADLYGKLANVCADISSNELSSSARFRAITGGDPIQGEHKFMPSFKFVPYSRLIFSANKFPPIKNPTNALFDRWIVIPFEKRFRGTENEDRDLLKKLLTPEEMSGVLNYALEGYFRLRRNGGFTVAKSSTRALDDFRLAADTVAAFVRDEMKEPDFYPRTNVYLMFEQWCNESGHVKMSRNQFYERLSDLIGNPVKVRGAHGWRVR